MIGRIGVCSEDDLSKRWFVEKALFVKRRLVEKLFCRKDELPKL